MSRRRRKKQGVISNNGIHAKKLLLDGNAKR
jgi:hypothetical protein